MKVVWCRSHHLVGLGLQGQATLLEQGQISGFACLHLRSIKSVGISIGRRIDQAKQAFGPVGPDRIIPTVLRADIHRSSFGQAAALKDVFEFAGVIRVKENVMTYQRKPAGTRTHGPSHGRQRPVQWTHRVYSGLDLRAQQTTGQCMGIAIEEHGVCFKEFPGGQPCSTSAPVTNANFSAGGAIEELDALTFG